MGGRSLEILHKVLPYGPHSCALPENIHGNGEGHKDKLDDADVDEDLLGAIRFQPRGEEQAENQAVKDVFAEIERDKCFARILSVGVHAEGDGCRRAQRAAEGDDAKEDGRHNPLVVNLG